MVGVPDRIAVPVSYGVTFQILLKSYEVTIRIKYIKSLLISSIPIEIPSKPMKKSHLSSIKSHKISFKVQKKNLIPI